MDAEGYPQAEEVLRLLAAAAYAARLYPPTSALPAEAASKFVERANQLTAAAGPVRYIVDPRGFRINEDEIAAGQSQVVSLADALHSLQVGQVIVAPGVSAPETAAFVMIANADPAAVRQRGGMRAMLVASGVARLAVIEVSLRQSEEAGLLGLDLLTAPFDEIAQEAVSAAEEWARAAQTGAATDSVATAVDRLEQATRDIATERVAAALMRLDEKTRMKVLGWSLQADQNGQRMQGMLDVVAKMKPASLARLLKLVAEQAGTDPQRIAGALALPPETAQMLALLLAPMPNGEPDFGASAEVVAQQIAEELAEPSDPGEIERQISVAAPQLASARALSTAVAVSRLHGDADSVRAIAVPLADAARDGAFPTVREALRRLDELAADPATSADVAAARLVLADPKVLADVVAAPLTDSDAAIAGEIMHAAGPAGAEALLTHYIHANEASKSLLRPVMRGMSEPILGVASKMLRSDDPATATAVLRTLPALGDKRAVPVIAGALDNLDSTVRHAAVTSLAETPAEEASAALIRAVNHWDPETQRWAILEIGRARTASAVPTLVRALDDISSGRTHDTKKQIISALADIGSPEALPAIKRVANRRLVFGKKNKELRLIARRAVAHLTEAQEAAQAASVSPQQPNPPASPPEGQYGTGGVDSQ